MIARELSERYECALLNLDQVIIDAIDSPQRNEYAQRAYQMCRDAHEKHLEEQRQAELEADHVVTAAQQGMKPNPFDCLFTRRILRRTFSSLVKSKARRSSSLSSKETSYESKEHPFPPTDLIPLLQ